jgi:hypothetical protein
LDLHKLTAQADAGIPSNGKIDVHEIEAPNAA